MSRNTVIPFCQTDFLQEVCIEFGLRLASNNPWFDFHAEAGTYAEDGEDMEMLTIWVQLNSGIGVRLNLIVYEDRSVWVRASSWKPNETCEYSAGFYIPAIEFAPAQIAEAFRDSGSAASRLCYDECPLPILRRIWHYDGPGTIEGKLRKAKG